MELNVRMQLRSGVDMAAVARWLDEAKAFEETTGPSLAAESAPGNGTVEPTSASTSAATASAPRQAGRARSKTATEAAAALSPPAQVPAEPAPVQAAPAPPPPPPSGAIPPGITVTVPQATLAAGQSPAVTAVQQPAMPKAEPLPWSADGGVTIEEVREAYAAANAKNKTAAFQVLRGETWSDGTPKQRWFSLDQCPSDQRMQLVMELSNVASGA